LALRLVSEPASMKRNVRRAAFERRKRLVK
jgi:hypothetical protein